MANIDTEIAEIEGASTGEEVRQSLVDGLNAVNNGTLPTVSQSDAGKFMMVNNSGQWEVKRGGLVPTPTGTKSITQNGTHDVTNYASADVNVPNSYSASDEGKVVDNGTLVSQTSRNVTQNGTYDTTTNDEVVVDVQGGGGGVIQSLSVTQNGTYTPPSGVDGYAPVTVNVSGGGVELMTETQWNALTTAQKQAKGLVAIQRYDTGYARGSLVNGADYSPASVYENGTAASQTTFTMARTGNYRLVVIALNSEASTWDLDVAVSINSAIVSGVTKKYNRYQGSGSDRRNYRIYVCDIDVNAGDEVSIVLTNRSGYTSFVYAVTDAYLAELIETISTADQTASGSCIRSGIVVYGTFNGGQGGTFNMSVYSEGNTVTTQNPGTNYKSAYIFWFDS